MKIKIGTRRGTTTKCLLTTRKIPPVTHANHPSILLALVHIEMPVDDVGKRDIALVNAQNLSRARVLGTWAWRETPPIIHSTLSAHSQLLMTDILVNNKKLRCLCDTGAEVNLLPLRFANRHGLLLNNLDGVKPVCVDQTPVNCSGVTFTSVKIGTSRVSTKFYFVEDIDHGILSLPLLSQLGAIIDCNKNTVSINGMPITNIPPTVQDTVVTTARVCRVQLTTSTVIHPEQEKLLSAKLIGQDDSPFEGIVEPTPEFVSRTGLAVAAVKVPKGQTTIPVCVANVWDHPIKVWRCQTVADLSETDMTSEPTSPSEHVAP